MVAALPLARTRRIERVYTGAPQEISAVRHDVGELLSGCSRADDAMLVISELATNAIMHSKSQHGTFLVLAEWHEQRRPYIWLEVTDDGGTWTNRPPDDRPHGLDLVELLAGPDNWFVESLGNGQRVVSVRLELT